METKICVPQAFRDLLTLAQGVEEFRTDYRMNAVLRACEAIVSGAEPNPAPKPSGPDPIVSWHDYGSSIDSVSIGDQGEEGDSNG